MTDTNLPDLRMLPVSDLLPHEDCDPRRVERLSERLRGEGLLKNPPIVAPIPDSNQFVILDGANRALAFAMLGVPHIVAQVVNYRAPDVILDTWYHVVAGLEIAQFEANLAQATGLHLQPASLEEAREALEQRRAAAFIICADGVRIVRNTTAPLKQDIHLLNQLVSVYRGKADIYRASNDVWEKQAPYYPKITALVIFPRLTPQDILDAARRGEKAPTGITRHVISYRALNINIPLAVMAADWPLARKEAWLQDWLMERMAANAIRYYSESTFSFNE
ncbi:MAG: hypothetical protein L0Z70_08555 [Chloroflexi bacterium]|nr:hypothetical protein [Chloroflexota bacterium]